MEEFHLDALEIVVGAFFNKVLEFSFISMKGNCTLDLKTAQNGCSVNMLKNL
jgi:hypothetical protein